MNFSFLSYSPVNEGERAENEDPNNTDMQSKNYPEAVIQDGHTHTCHGLKNERTYLKMPKKNKRLPTNFKEAHWETPGKNPVKTRTR